MGCGPLAWDWVWDWATQGPPLGHPSATQASRKGDPRVGLWKWLYLQQKVKNAGWGGIGISVDRDIALIGNEPTPTPMLIQKKMPAVLAGTLLCGIPKAHIRLRAFCVLFLFCPSFCRLHPPTPVFPPELLRVSPCRSPVDYPGQRASALLLLQ